MSDLKQGNQVLPPPIEIHDSLGQALDYSLAGSSRSTLLTWHERFVAQICKGIAVDRGFARFVEEYVSLTKLLALEASRRDDPILHRNVCSFLALLLDVYPGLFPKQQQIAIKNILDEQLQVATTSYLELVDNQVEVLRHCFGTIVNELNNRRASIKRVVFIEFPVGNSLPSHVFAKALKARGYPAEILRVDLSSAVST